MPSQCLECLKAKVFKLSMPSFLMPESVWTSMRPKDKILKVLPQTGKRISIPRDYSRKAMPPGKRISKAGNEYFETRKNRTDILKGRL